MRCEGEEDPFPDTPESEGMGDGVPSLEFCCPISLSLSSRSLPQRTKKENMFVTILKLEMSPSLKEVQHKTDYRT